MKKSLLMIFLLICIVLAGCTSAGTASQTSQEDISDLSDTIEADLAADPFSRNLLGLIDTNTSQNRVAGNNKETVPDSIDGLSFDDFDFYYDIMNEGIPEDVYYPAIKYAEGLWKYDLFSHYDPDDGYYFEEIGYAEFEIDYDKEQITITLHPRMGNDGYYVWEETDEIIGYEPWSGGFDSEGNLRLYGNNAVLDCQSYYAYSGREYFTGELWTSEESSFAFLMTRGQE